ncbi:hypothetical protein QE152_g4934 [Popillia japonica]|uniref:Uncharacterized protein n=1 Tax=Popillia japonica TaxID=7064 RepID=A0AAW1MQY5_POPJA
MMQHCAAVNGVFFATGSGGQFRIVKLVRLGRFIQSSTRPQPIKATLGAESEVHDLIRHAKHLKSQANFASISLRYDRTPRQQKLYEELRDQLNERVANREQNLKIRYHDGSPKITQAKN